MAPRALNFVCQNCGAAYGALAGQVRGLRRVEHARRGGGRRVRGDRARPRARQGPAVRARAARRRERRRRRACRPAWPSSTASPAAASCAARCCWSAAIPASASRRCCCRPPPRWRDRGHRVGLHLRRGSGRAGAAARRAARRWPTRRCELAAETIVEDIIATLSGRHAAAPRRHQFDPDAVDRHASNPRPARSRRCAARRRR